MPRFIAWPAVALACCGFAGCTMQPASKPAFLTVQKPPVHTAPKPDWFQIKLADARAARRAHLPKSDIAGARQAYFQVALAACTHIDAHGLTRYRKSCNALLRQSVAFTPAPREDMLCDEGADDPDKIVACND